jgi:SAM-dependent methyltransferase
MPTFCCDFCGSPSYREKQRYSLRLGILQTRFRVIQCQSCGLVCLFPQPTDAEQVAIYDNYADKGNRATVENNRCQGVYDVKISRLRQLAPGDRLLDVGAGLGTFVRMASEAGFEAVGVEYGKEQCEQALALNGVKLRHGLLEEIWKRLGTFDVAHLHHVLEHARSPRQILDLLHTLLRAGGVLLIEVPNQFFNIAKEVRSSFGPCRPETSNPLHHLYFFSPRTLSRYAIPGKFEILELNQFRERRMHMPIWERVPKDFYRWGAQCLGVGAGSIIEIYLRKSGGPKTGVLH